MTSWFDVTTSINWNRPPVGIVRTEVEVIKASLKRDDSAYFRITQKGPVQVPSEQVAQHMRNLSQPKRDLPKEDKVHTRRSAFPRSLNDLRMLAMQRVSTLSPAQRMLFMRCALPLNAIFDFIIQFRPFVAGVKRHLKAQLDNESVQYRATTKSEKPRNLVREFLTDNDLKSCEENCQWRIFAEGDIVFSAGLLWDYMDFTRLNKEKHNHKFLFANVCYDLIPVKFPQFVPDKFPDKFLEYAANLLWTSDHFFCISKTTESDLQDFAKELGFPKELSTSIVTLGDEVAKESLPIKQIEDLGKDIILYVSTIERRKNHELILSVLEELNYPSGENLPIVVFVGMAGWHVDELFRDIALNPKLKFPDGTSAVKILNNVSDQNLKWLYEKSLFSVFPSFYEGWGLPVGESLIHGTPVIASDRGSLLEASQGRAAHIHPKDLITWARLIGEYIREPEKLNEAREQARKYKPREWSDFGLQVIDTLQTRRKSESK